MYSLTYGRLPTRHVFNDSWKLSFPKEGYRAIYRIRNDKIVGDVDWTIDEVHQWIVNAINGGDKKELDLASSILYTLGIEWV